MTKQTYLRRMKPMLSNRFLDSTGPSALVVAYSRLGHKWSFHSNLECRIVSFESHNSPAVFHPPTELCGCPDFSPHSCDQKLTLRHN